MEYHHAAYEAYWDQRADLGDPSVLADIGSSIGLDGAELKERVESGHYAQKVVDQYHEALGYGIRGIPNLRLRQPPVHRRATLRGLPAGDG